MEILSEKEETFVNLEVTFSEEEYNLLLNYALDNLPNKKVKELLIDWAFRTILQKQIEEEELLI